MPATSLMHKVPSEFDPTHETLTVEQFAKRVHRDKKTVYKWIRWQKMPEGTVLRVQGHYEVDWTVYCRSIRLV